MSCRWCSGVPSRVQSHLPPSIPGRDSGSAVTLTWMKHSDWVRVSCRYFQKWSDVSSREALWRHGQMDSLQFLSAKRVYKHSSRGGIQHLERSSTEKNGLQAEWINTQDSGYITEDISAELHQLNSVKKKRENVCKRSPPVSFSLLLPKINYS